jgi:hypothetical protein
MHYFPRLRCFFDSCAYGLLGLATQITYFPRKITYGVSNNSGLTLREEIPDTVHSVENANTSLRNRDALSKLRFALAIVIIVI